MNKAKECALRILEPLTKQLEEAYNQGYRDALNGMAHKIIDEHGITFVDLGLDSGLLWSSNVLPGCKFNYYDAQKLNIPTKEQFEEMISHCRYVKGYTFIGPNGEKIGGDTRHGIWVWVKSNAIEDKATAYALGSDNGNNEPRQVHTGVNCSVFLVKNSEK